MEVPGLVLKGTLAGLQMVFPESAEVLADRQLGGRDFDSSRVTTQRRWWSLRRWLFRDTFGCGRARWAPIMGCGLDGRLVSMAGERFAFDRYVEISGVCTHPEYTGRGYAAALITRLLLDHRRDGWLSCLHLSAANKRAKDLYARLGFVVNREVRFHRVVRR